MSPVDIKIISRKAKKIEEDLSLLYESRPQSYEEFITNVRIQLLVERLLEKIVGRVLDINYHVLSEKYNTVPSEYRESFVLMGKKGDLPKKLAQSLSDSAGLRNALVHEYDEIDPKKVYNSVDLALTQIPKYLKYILKSANITPKPKA